MGAQFYFLVALCVIIGRYTVAGAEVPDSEGRYVSRLEQLKRRLFRESGYDATARPVNNTAEPTTVHITIIFPDITHVALEDGWFTLKLWICTNWYDYRLTWNAEDYNRTFHITAKLTEVWWPKLEIVNAGGQDLNSFEDIVVLHPDGHIWVCPAFSVKAACAVDLSLFPNDEQVCSLRFASTAYNADEVKLLEGNVWGEYQSEASTEWNITEALFSNHTALNRSFVDLAFHLRRLGGRYRYTVTIPSIASAMMMLALYWVPPESDRRLTVLSLNILCIMLLLHRYSGLMASSVKAPNMLVFLGVAATVQVVNAVGCIIVLNLVGSSSVRLKLPDAVHRVLTGAAGTFLCLMDPAPVSTVHTADNTDQLSSFDDVRETKGRWLLFAQALDRLFFLVFGLMTLSLLL